LCKPAQQQGIAEMLHRLSVHPTLFVQASANLVAVAFVHAGKTRRFNLSFSPYSTQQQHVTTAAAAPSITQPLQLSSNNTQEPAAAALASQGRITQRLRWSDGDAVDAAPHVHFESYSDAGQLLTSWTVQSEYAYDLASTSVSLVLLTTAAYKLDIAVNAAAAGLNAADTSRAPAPPFAAQHLCNVTDRNSTLVSSY
jgi:hypothetical protein